MRCAIFISLCASTLIFAQVAQATDAERQYVGIIDGKDVYVRSGPGITAYPCAQLSHPATVTVVASRAGWLKIAAPPGTYSVISKQFVRLDSTGKSGTVTGPNVWVRAGGNLRSEDFWAIQRRMTRGATVRILGQIGGFYKVAPPAGAYFWISERYVRRAKAGQIPIPVEPQAPSKTPRKVEPLPDAATEKSPEAKTSAPPAKKTDVIKTTMTADEIKKAEGRFRAVDKLLVAEFDKKPKKRNLQAVIKHYEALRAMKGNYLNPYIDARIDYISTAIQRQKDIDAVDKLVTETTDKQKEYDSRLTTLDKEGVTGEQPERFVATGILARSATFQGAIGRATRYALHNPASRNIIAYAQCSTGRIDLSDYIGKNVGLIGKKSYENELGTVVEVSKVKILGEGGGLPLPAKPTVVPYTPKLAPSGDEGSRKPAVKPILQPLPIIEPLPKPIEKPRPQPKIPTTPQPKPKAETTVVEKPKPEPPVIKPRPKPQVPAPIKPKAIDTPNIDGVPLIVPHSSKLIAPPISTTKPTITPKPRPKPKPLVTEPAPAPKPVVPTPKPPVKKRPKPDPPAGLPIAEPDTTNSESIDESEYE